MGIKHALKRIDWLYRCNAIVRAFLLKRRNARLNAFYGAWAKSVGLVYDRDRVVARVKATLESRGLHDRQKAKGTLTIVWVGANKDQDYGGFIQSLKRFGTVHCLEREDGAYGQEFPVDGKYDAAVCRRNGDRLIRLVTRLLSEGTHVDLVWGQMWADYIDIDALQKIQKMGIPTANVAMDDRLPDLWAPTASRPVGFVGLGVSIDLSLTSAPECLIRYETHGYPAIFWPMASDPEVFFSATTKDIPVCFVGNKYGIRERLVRHLQANGIQVEAFGGGWPNGPVAASAVADIFSRSQIILGIGTVGHATDVYTLKLRDFDATMAGSLYVTHRNPDLLSLFEEGKELECYSTFEEAASKISHYLAHPEQAKKVGDSAARKARAMHTWDTRISEALGVLGLI